MNATRHCRVHRLLVLVGVLLIVGCVSEERTSQPLGGGWFNDRVRVSGWEPSYATHQLRYGDVVVDTDIDVEDVYFFEPDCVIYSTNRESGPSYVVCSDRVPVRLPFSTHSVDVRAVWGDNRIRAGQEQRQMLLLRDVLAVAAAQPTRDKDWRWTLNAASLPIEPQWVNR